MIGIRQHGQTPLWWWGGGEEQTGVWRVCVGDESGEEGKKAGAEMRKGVDKMCELRWDRRWGCEIVSVFESMSRYPSPGSGIFRICLRAHFTECFFLSPRLPHIDKFLTTGRIWSPLPFAPCRPAVSWLLHVASKEPSLHETVVVVTEADGPQASELRA